MDDFKRKKALETMFIPMKRDDIIRYTWLINYWIIILLKQAAVGIM